MGKVVGTDGDRFHESGLPAAEELSDFAESYASFNRIVNSLQRKYIDLKEEFTAQNQELVEANKKLVDLSRFNLATTDFLNGLLTSVPIGVVAVDKDGHITHFNPAASTILGIPASEPMGKHYRDLMPQGLPLEANALRTAETGREVISVEKKLDLRDGSRLHLSVSTSLLTDDFGRNAGAVEVFHDMTRVKKMEAEIARLNTLAALGEMAATVAHEVRNPLASISGFAALLERDMEPDDERRQLVQKIVRGVSNLNETVTTLLNYTRFDELTTSENIYESFLKAVIEQFQIDSADQLDNVSLSLKVPPLNCRLVFDRMLFRQVFFNLFSNAVDACDGRGEIDVSFRVLPRSAAVEKYTDRVLLEQNETIVETIVADNGTGIEEKHLSKVFAPFFSNKQGGNGLGLAVAWKIVKAHNGDITVRNRENGGAEFTIAIPTPIRRDDRER